MQQFKQISTTAVWSFDAPICSVSPKWLVGLVLAMFLNGSLLSHSPTSWKRPLLLGDWAFHHRRLYIMLRIIFNECYVKAIVLCALSNLKTKRVFIGIRPPRLFNGVVGRITGRVIFLSSLHRGVKISALRKPPWHINNAATNTKPSVDIFRVRHWFWDDRRIEYLCSLLPTREESLIWCVTENFLSLKNDFPGTLVCDTYICRSFVATCLRFRHCTSSSGIWPQLSYIEKARTEPDISRYLCELDGHYQLYHHRQYK